jgi:hypothetical protein
MAKSLITMLPANVPRLPTRLVPIARVLADRGHEGSDRIEWFAGH